MNGPSYAHNAPGSSKHDACIQQAGMDFGIAHCLDGTTHWFRDDYARSLRAAVKLVPQIFNNRPMFFSEHEQDDLTGRLKACRSLPSPDRDDVPVIDVLLRNLLTSRFNQLVGTMADRREMDIFARELFEEVCHEGERTQAVARAIEWQRKSSADGMRVKHAIDAAFPDDEPVFAYKVALLRKPFVPANEEAAYALHERAKNNDLLFQQTMTGERVYDDPDVLHRPSIALLRSDLRVLQNCLDRATFISYLLRVGVITVNFSRVHGLYLSAVLLADGRNSAAWEDLADKVGRLWAEVTEGDGHVHQWHRPQCSWAGLIEPHDTAKKDALLLELECRALREKYVRAKSSETLPTFTLIQPALTGLQSKEHHYA